MAVVFESRKDWVENKYSTKDRYVIVKADDVNIWYVCDVLQPKPSWDFAYEAMCSTSSIHFAKELCDTMNEKADRMLTYEIKREYYKNNKSWQDE